MPRANSLQTAFNSGELSPRMAARVDIDKYQNASATAQNLISIPQGGYMRRPGTRFIAEVKDSSVKGRLLDFEFNVTQAYMIEAGDGIFRFKRNQGVISADDTDASITNGTFDSDTSGWTDESGAGGSISHDSTNNRLNITSDGTDDGHAEQEVTVGASFENNAHTLKFTVYGAPGDEIKLRIGTSSTGTQIINDRSFQVGYHVFTFTPGNSSFFLQFLHTTSKTLQIDNVSLIENAPVEVDTPYAEADLFSIQKAQSADVMYLARGSTTPIYKLLRLGHTSWSVVEVEFTDGPYLDQNLTSTTLNPGATTGLGITVTASSTTGINDGDGFKDTDIGRLVRMQQSASADAGYGIIVARNSSTSVDIDIKRDFDSATATENWWLGEWSKTTGYPSVVTFFEQRLFLANSTDNTQGFWGSQSADFENLRPDSFVDSALTVEDDDALDFTVASRRVNAIRWMAGSRSLLLGTSGGEWVVQSEGATLTPTDIDVKLHTASGSADITPVNVNEKILFVQRAKRKVLDLGFAFEIDGYTGRDTTILSDHVTRGGVVELAYQQEPDSVVWAVRNDGQLLALTYKVEQQIIGWTRQVIGGSFSDGDAVVESVATIPGADDTGQTYNSGNMDEVWVIVKRTIDGATKRYIEVLEGIFEGPIRHDYDSDAEWKAAMIAAQEDAFYVDSGLTYDGAATSTLTGLDHLEGETVKILADGAVHPEKTVSSGSVTLDFEVTKAQVGLGYTHKYKSLKLAFGARAGTAVGKVKRVHGITFVLLDSATFQFGRDLSNLNTAEFRNVDDDMDTAVPLFTGERHVDFGGQYARDARIHAQSDAPLPWVMLALAPELQTNEMV